MSSHVPSSAPFPPSLTRLPCSTLHRLAMNPVLLVLFFSTQYNTNDSEASPLRLGATSPTLPTTQSPRPSSSTRLRWRRGTDSDRRNTPWTFRTPSRWSCLCSDNHTQNPLLRQLRQDANDKGLLDRLVKVVEDGLCVERLVLLVDVLKHDSIPLFLRILLLGSCLARSLLCFLGCLFMSSTRNSSTLCRCGSTSCLWFLRWFHWTATFRSTSLFRLRFVIIHEVFLLYYSACCRTSSLVNPRSSSL